MEGGYDGPVACCRRGCRSFESAVRAAYRDRVEWSIRRVSSKSIPVDPLAQMGVFFSM